MNLLQIKYIIEVEKTQSITWAADNLYMSQPNLSKSIRELEEELDVNIFKRTPKGMIPTAEGEEVLSIAKKILSYTEVLKKIGRKDNKEKQVFGISVPRASYIFHAFTRFMTRLDYTKPIEFDYSETNSMQAVENVLENKHNIAIVRYRKKDQYMFENLFQKKELIYEEISEFSNKILMSVNHPLAKNDKLNFAELIEYTEILYGDSYIPANNPVQAKETETIEAGNKWVYIYERSGQLDLLREVPTTYMWTSPIPPDILERNKLIMRDCDIDEQNRLFKDVLIHHNTYQLSDLDRKFIDELFKYRNILLS